MDRKTLLANYATDMLTVEEHILDAVEHQASTDAVTKYPSASAIIARIETTMRAHTASLETYVDGLGEGDLKAKLKNALTETLGFAAGMVNKIRQTDQVSRMLRDDYAALSFAAICYHMLHTTALSLKDQQLADLALSNLDDVTPIIMDLSEAICRVVVAELTDEDRTIDPTVADEAIRNTQRTWRTQSA